MPIDALNVLCAQLTRDPLAIAIHVRLCKFLFTFGSNQNLPVSQVFPRHGTLGLGLYATFPLDCLLGLRLLFELTIYAHYRTSAHSTRDIDIAILTVRP